MTFKEKKPFYSFKSLKIVSTAAILT